MLKRLLRIAKFELDRRVSSAPVGDVPHFDPGSMPVFEKHLGAARSYLEFGMGGSTVRAAALQVPGMSVESDRLYLKAVARKIAPFRASRRLVHADIGWTGPWGYPRLKKPTARRHAQWRKYVTVPFREQGEGFYDLVLIDGRFRVACMLETIRQASHRDAALNVLFDDYASREYYHVVEEYVPLSGMAGRMAIFDVRPSTMKKIPEAADIDQYISDVR